MALSNQGLGGRFSWYPKPYTKYSAYECTVSGTDWSILENTSMFDHMESANDILIRSSGDTAYIKFNDPDNDAISLTDGDFFNTSNLRVTDIFITCSGSANMKFFFLGWR